MSISKTAAPKLTIGIATYDDFDGLYFSLQAVRMYHPDVLNECELLVVDNHPDGAHARAIHELAKLVPLRYVAYHEVSGSAAKDIVFREARGEYVLCMDSHVLFPSGTLRRLICYLDEHPETPDLLQGPLLVDDLRTCFTHYAPEWHNGGFGKWAIDPRGLDVDAEPFEIPMQGMGVFACRRSAWPGLNPRFQGFAIEEGYVHEKFRRAGGRCLCLPFLRWVHRFHRPAAAPYPYRELDRFRNLMIAFRELGWDFAGATAHWATVIGAGKAARLTRAVEVVLGNPFYFFDGVFCIRSAGSQKSWDETVARLRGCRVRAPIRRIDSLRPDTPALLMHREVIARAQRRQWRSVMVFDENVAFEDSAVEDLKAAVSEARGREWSTMRVRGFHFENGSEMEAVAYSETVFGGMLDELAAAEHSPALHRFAEAEDAIHLRG